MMKLYDMVDSNFDSIYHQQIDEQNANRNRTRLTLDIMSKVSCVDRELFMDEKEASRTHYVYTNFD